jgi:hypothetical protein
MRIKNILVRSILLMAFTIILLYNFKCSQSNFTTSANQYEWVYKGVRWDEMLSPWAPLIRKEDKKKQHEEIITFSAKKYSIKIGGTLDGYMTRSPIGVFSWQQNWENNVALRIENVGTIDVVNPWISNEFTNTQNIQNIIYQTSDKKMEAQDLVKALYYFIQQRKFHACLYEPRVETRASLGYEYYDNEQVIKLINVYGYGSCREVTAVFNGLCRNVGFMARIPAIINHTTSEIFYDNNWHFFDADYNVYFFEPNTNRILSYKELTEDHDLIRRSHVFGVDTPENLLGDGKDFYTNAGYIKRFFSERFRGANFHYSLLDHSMDFTLRPGEAITWKWGYLVPRKYRGWKAPSTEEYQRSNINNFFYNGMWEYKPDLSSNNFLANIAQGKFWYDPVEGLRLKKEYEKGNLVIKMSNPYVIVGGSLELKGSGLIITLSYDGKKWYKLDTGNLDSFFYNLYKPAHMYYINIHFNKASYLHGLKIINDFQVAPLSLPDLRLGENHFTYSDKSVIPGDVKVTHVWYEREEKNIPNAPLLRPENYFSSGDNSKLILSWDAPKNVSEDLIQDYHVELSSHPDMLFPLSPYFSRLISKMKNSNKKQFVIPSYMALEPYKKYYWHVRAKTKKGIWSKFSMPQRFQYIGPSYPKNIEVDYDNSRRLAIIKWNMAEVGLKPKKIIIYASYLKHFNVTQKDIKKTVYDYNLIGNKGKKIFVIIPYNQLMPYYRIASVSQEGLFSAPSKQIEIEIPHSKTK